MALKGEVEPAGQPNPVRALQSPEQLARERPVAFPKVPEEQGVQVEMEDAPVTLE